MGQITDINQALGILRKVFAEFNKEDIEIADKAASGKAYGIVLGKNDIGIIDAVKVLKKHTFFSPELHQLFEYLLLYGTLKHNAEFRLNFFDYINKKFF